MKRYRVAIISPEFPPLTNWGGIATFNKQLFLLLKSMGCDVHVITYGKKSSNSHSKRNRIHYVSFKTNNKYFNFIYYHFPVSTLRSILAKLFPSLTFTLEWNIFALICFLQLNAKYKFQIIHTPTYFSPAWSIKLFCKDIFLVIHVTGRLSTFNRFNSVNLDSKIRAWFENKYLQKYSDKTVACSRYEFENVVRAFPFMKQKTIFINNFMENSRIVLQNKINVNNFVYFGRLEYRKGVDIIIKTFIKMFRVNKNINLYLIGGNGACFKENGKFINFNLWKKRNDVPDKILKHIHFLPYIDSKTSLQNLLKKLRGIGVFPARYEPFGYSVIESMSFGYITVTSSKSGSKEVVKNGVNGFVIKPTCDELYKCLNSILTASPLLLKKISVNARSSVLNTYNFEYAINEYRNLYDGYFS